MSGNNSYLQRNAFREAVAVACVLKANASGGANDPSIEYGHGFTTPIYNSATGKYKVTVGPASANRLPGQTGGRFFLTGCNPRPTSSSDVTAVVQAITRSSGITTLSIEWRVGGTLTNMSDGDRIDLAGFIATGADADDVRAV